MERYKKRKLGTMGVRQLYKSSSGRVYFKVKGNYYPIYPKRR